MPAGVAAGAVVGVAELGFAAAAVVEAGAAVALALIGPEPVTVTAMFPRSALTAT
jgi:hypothetical protein